MNECGFELTKKCTHCHQSLFDYVPDGATHLSQCFTCGSEHLYRQKDFNRKLGIGLVTLGVLLAYFTYGISLLVVAIIDFVIYRLVGEVVCCYKCHTQYRGEHEAISHVPSFNLSLHDYYDNLRRNAVVET